MVGAAGVVVVTEKQVAMLGHVEDNGDGDGPVRAK